MADFLTVFGIFYEDIFQNSSFCKESLNQILSEKDFDEVVNGFINYFEKKLIDSSNPDLTLKNLAKSLNYTDKKKYEKNPQNYRGIVFQFYKALRIMLTHQENGISLDDIIDVLGYKRIINRLKAYL